MIQAKNTAKEDMLGIELRKRQKSDIRRNYSMMRTTITSYHQSLCRKCSLIICYSLILMKYSMHGQKNYYLSTIMFMLHLCFNHLLFIDIFSSTEHYVKSRNCYSYMYLNSALLFEA